MFISKRNEKYSKRSLSIPLIHFLILCILLNGLIPLRQARSDQTSYSLSSKLYCNLLVSDINASGEKPAKGKFLVASRDSNDPIFIETVVLLVDYGTYGAKGYIINRPSDISLSELFIGIEIKKEKGEMLYFGGPVATYRIAVLLQSDKKPEGSDNIFEDIYLSTRSEEWKAILENEKIRFRVLSGYTGWAPGQLDWELSEGMWHVVDGDKGSIFMKPWSKVWQDLIDQVSGSWVRAWEKELL